MSLVALLQITFVLICKGQSSDTDSSVSRNLAIPPPQQAQPPLQHLVRHAGSKCCIIRDRGHGREAVSMLCDADNRCQRHRACEAESFTYAPCGAADPEGDDPALPCCLAPGILCNADGGQRQCAVHGFTSGASRVCGPQLCPSLSHMSAEMQSLLRARNITIPEVMARHDGDYRRRQPNRRKRQDREKWERLDHARSARHKATMPLYRDPEHTTKHLPMSVAAAQMTERDRAAMPTARENNAHK
jgi:hypothetical protein